MSEAEHPAPARRHRPHRRRPVRRAAHSAVVPAGRGRREPRGGRAAERRQVRAGPRAPRPDPRRQGHACSRRPSRSPRSWSTASSSSTTSARTRGQPRARCSDIDADDVDQAPSTTRTTRVRAGARRGARRPTTAQYVAEHRDDFPRASRDRDRRALATRNDVAGRRHASATSGGSTPRSTRRTRSTATQPDDIDRQDRHRADLRVRAARHARARTGARSTTAAGHRRRQVTQAGSRSRRAAHHRHRRPAGRRGVAAQGMEVPARWSTPTRQLLQGDRGGAVVVLDAAHRRGGGAGVEPHVRSQPVRRPAPRRVLRPDPALQLIDRALEPYAPGSTFKMFTAMAQLQRPDPGGRRRQRTTTRVLRVRERREAMQRARKAVLRHRRSCPRR